MKTLYADGISDIAIINGVVRLDLFRLEPEQTAGDGRPAVKQVRELTLALPLDGLLGSLDLLDRVRADLRRGTGQHAPVVHTPAIATPDIRPEATLPTPARSPNFS